MHWKNVMRYGSVVYEEFVLQSQHHGMQSLQVEKCVFGSQSLNTDATLHERVYLSLMVPILS